MRARARPMRDRDRRTPRTRARTAREGHSRDGTIAGHAPTGRKVTFTALDMVRIKDGRARCGTRA
jgi:predicted ester cyclase